MRECLRANTLTPSRSPYGPPWQGDGRFPPLHNMINIRSLSFSALTTVLLLLAIVGPASAFRITAYNTNIVVHKDSSFDVAETITADFTGDPHHGIYRDIPFSGRDRFGNNVRIRFDHLAVTDEKGLSLNTQQSNRSGKLHLRIGDPNVMLNGISTYVIRYRVVRAIHFFDEHDEIYWNVIGPDWEVPIDNAVCTVILPSDQKNGIMMQAFSGRFGSTTSDVQGTEPDKRTACFWMSRTLSPGEEMTVVVGWAKGVVQQPDFKQDAQWFASDNGWVLLPFIFLIGMVGVWRVAGKDPDTGRSEVVSYDPPKDMTPAEIGTLIDEQLDMRDISATIIDLAVRGYIRITPEVETGLTGKNVDYSFELLEPYEKLRDNIELSPFEQALIGGLFCGLDSVWMSGISGRFYHTLGQLQDIMYDSMVDNGYFSYRPDTVRTAYRYGGLAVFFAGVFYAIYAFVMPGVLIASGWGVGVALCGVISALAAGAMPRKTAKGTDAFITIKGFEEYLSRAERSQIEQQERQNTFEKYLPYAIAFGIADKWAKAFDGLQKIQPDWYGGDDSTFRPSLFAHDLNRASMSWGNALSSSPRSDLSSGSGSGGSGGFFSGGSGFGGGGFSGGGCGGGGGGGW